MVLVAVGQHDASQLAPVLQEETDVGDHQVHAQAGHRAAARKHHSGIDQNQVVPGPEGGAVHSEFPQPAQRDDFQPTAHLTDYSMRARHTNCSKDTSSALRRGSIPALWKAGSRRPFQGPKALWRLFRRVFLRWPNPVLISRRNWS